MKRVFKFTLSFLWLAVASVLFFLPGSALPPDTDFWILPLDKWAHIGIFFILLYLWSWAMRLQTVQAYALLLLSCLLYGFGVELVQKYFIPGRSFDLTDLLADSAGAVMALGCWMFWTRNQKGRG